MDRNFLLGDEGKAFLEQEYISKKRSTYDIAEELETYPNMIRRALLKHNISLRDKGEAQKSALESGRHTHPTEGKERTHEEKIKISNSMASAWENLSEAERAQRVEKAKTNWNKLTDEEKGELQKLAGQGIRRAAADGSRLEQFLLTSLQMAGYNVKFHAEYLINAESMHIDMVLPDLKVAIEIDGPTHYLPIWSEEQLAKTIAADNKKTGLLVQAGYVVLRVKHLTKSLSDYKLRTITERVIKAIKKIEKSFPAKCHRLIEVEA